jgi:uncharacterized protein YggE
MKRLNYLMLLLSCSLLTTAINAQVRGNANIYQQKESMGNAPAAAGNVYGNTYNNIPTAAKPTANAVLYNDYTVLLNTRVLMNVRADSYTAIFHLTQVGETAADADKFINERIDGLKAALKGLGVASEDIETDIISLVPIFEYELEKKIFSKKYNEVPKGFELKKNIHVRYTKSTMLDKIVTAAAQHEIYDLVKVDYFIKNMEAVYDQMRAAAMLNHKKKVEQQKQLGIDLTETHRVASDASTVTFPLECYDVYQAFSAVSLDKGKLGKPAEKPTSYYYNAITPKGYDVVINSEIVEPVVQFTYDLKVKFLVQPPVKEVKQPEVIKKFFIIGENGSITELPTN